MFLMRKNTNIQVKNYLFTNKDLIKLIIPLIIEQFLSVAVGMVDSIMIASVGEAAVSAVSLFDTVNILIINVFSALATGGAVIAGQYIGKKQEDKACETAGQLLLFVGILSVIVMGFVYLGRNFILDGVFGKIEPDVRAYTNTYLSIVTMSIPFIALYNGGAALFRIMGNSKVPMFTSLIMNLVNIVGNAIMIYGLNMEVAGAAIPTLVSRIIAAIIVVLLLCKQDLTVHIERPFRLHFNLKMIRKILHIGVPNGLENSMFQLGKILMLSVVAGFGTASITANAVGNAVANFQILPGLAINLAVLTVVSRCVGAGDYQQARYYTRKLLFITYISLIIINVIIFLALPWILIIYNLSDITSQLTRQILICHGSFCMLLWPVSFTLPNTLRAANDVRFSMLVSIFSMWVWRIGFSIILAKYLNFGVLGVWFAMIIDWVVRCIFFITRYIGKKWELQKI